MKIWIDADAAPREVKDVVFRAAKRLDLETILVANQGLAVPGHAARVSVVAVPPRANAADKYIVENANSGDLVVTADIPLAALLVDKNVLVVDPRGEEYHQDNVASKLSMRDFMDGLRGAGEVTRGKPPYSASDKKAFAQTLDRLLQAQTAKLKSKRLSTKNRDASH